MKCGTVGLVPWLSSAHNPISLSCCTSQREAAGTVTAYHISLMNTQNLLSVTMRSMTAVKTFPSMCITRQPAQVCVQIKSTTQHLSFCHWQETLHRSRQWTRWMWDTWNETNLLTIFIMAVSFSLERTSSSHFFLSFDDENCSKDETTNDAHKSISLQFLP